MSDETGIEQEVGDREPARVQHVQMDWSDNYALSLFMAVERIEGVVKLLSDYVRPVSPNYRQRLDAYWTFDWSEMGAEVMGEDAGGVSQVLWGGYIWMRRSGSGKYGKSIWFSRAKGKSETGDTAYLRLITFKDGGRPEPLDRQIMNGQVPVQRNTPSPTVSVPTEPELTAEQIARQMDNLEQFDIYFVKANPVWKEAKYVKAARHKLGRALTRSHLYDALVKYEEAYSSTFETLGRQAADAEATLAGKRVISEEAKKQRSEEVKK